MFHYGDSARVARRIESQRITYLRRESITVAERGLPGMPLFLRSIFLQKTRLRRLSALQSEALLQWYCQRGPGFFHGL
jgi:hypothetical protein